MSESRASFVGSTIAGKFLIEELLGSGSMGQVYRARHLHLEQTVALKVMSSELASEPSFAARFEREAKASFSLAHPNVIRVIDYGRDGTGLTYLAMEYVAGGDLAGLIYRTPNLGAKRIALLMRQALAGIAAAHDAGVIHRDLKPENIMIADATDDDGQVSDHVKVCDFGIAKLIDHSAESPRGDAVAGGRKLTEVGLVIGTPEYMAPEQGRGELVDARSDIYAMGVVLYELLTGDLPFVGATAVATVMKQISEEPIRPSMVRPGVDPQLEAICLKAMSKSQGARFQTAREMRLSIGAAIGLRESGQSIPPLPAAAPHSRVPAKPTESELPLPAEDVRTAATLVARESAVPASDRLMRIAQSRIVMAVAGAAIVFIAASASTRLLRGPEPVSNGQARPLDDAPITSTIAPETNDPPVAPGAQDPQANNAIASNGVPALPPGSAADAPFNATGPKVIGTIVTPKGGSTPIGVPKPAPSSASASSASPGSSGSPSTLANGNPIAPVSPEPAVTPPATVPAPVAAPVARPPVAPTPAAPAFDPSTARATISGINDVQGARKSDVQNAIARSSSRFVACYQTDLRSASTPTSGAGVLRIETDDSGTVTSAHLNAPLSSSGARCIERAVLGVKIQNVDTGQAQADVAISFELR